MAEKKNMGIGVLGQPDIDFKRKARFTFEIIGFCNNEKNVVPEHFVKASARPSWSTEPIELNHLNGKTWLSGKVTLNTITVTYYDATSAQMGPLYNWLATIYDFTDPVGLRMGSKRDWDATGILNMFDGCGTLLEQWELRHMFAEEVNFGDVAYEANEMAEIELTLRFSDMKYTSFCPKITIAPCCNGCEA